MPKINPLASQRNKPSGTIALFNVVKQMRDSGADIVSFTAGEVDLDSPESAKNAAIEAIKQNFTRYTISDGIPELRTTVAEFIEHQTGQKYQANEIIICNGCKQASYNLLAALIAEGDEVILPVPYFPSHIRQIEMLGAEARLVQTSVDEKFQIKKEMLKQALSDKSRVLFVTSPQNPTGAVYNRDSLTAIAEFAIENDLWLMFDEIYSGIVYPPAKFEAILKVIPEIKERLLLVNALSKSFAMTGWRVGFGAAPANVIKQASNVQANTTSNVCSFAQKGAQAALSKDADFAKTFLADFQEKRDFAFEYVSKINGVKCNNPDGAFYLFPNIDSFIGKKSGTKVMESSGDISHYLLTEHNLAVVPGEAFGAPGHVRINFALEREVVEKGLGRFKKGLESLQ